MTVALLAWGILGLTALGEGYAVGALLYHHDTHSDRIILAPLSLWKIAAGRGRG